MSQADMSVPEEMWVVALFELSMRGRGAQEGERSDPSPGSSGVLLLLPPLTHVVDRENHQTCRRPRRR